MDVVINELDIALYILAAIILILELTVIGLSGPLLFFSLGCFITGALVTAEAVITLQTIILSIGVASLVSAFLLWEPLKKMQGNKTVRDTSSDLIGQTVIVTQKVTMLQGKVRFSGIDWNAKLEVGQTDEGLAIEGSSVIVSGVEGNVLKVKPL